MDPIFFAVLAAAAFGLWTVFHKLASPHINQIFGAIIISLTAVLFGSIALFVKFKDIKLFTDVKGIYFLIFAGISAFFIDFLALHAYSKGLPISIGGPVIIGGSIAIAIVIGFFLGDTVTALKALGLGLIIAGAVILAAIS